jgi:hypothetical protein
MADRKRNQRITIEGYTYSEGELEWAGENLGYMRRTLRDNTILFLTLAVTFIVGIVFYLLADGLNTGAIPLPEGWRTDLIADFIYNFGLILWTSVILALFLEVGVEYSRKRAQQYYARALHTLQQGVSLPNEVADEEVDLPDDISAKLDAIMAKLAVIDHLQADVTALKTERPLDQGRHQT